MRHKSRNSNIELLRIISMFLIVLHHFAIHGIFNSHIVIANLTINKMLAEFLIIGGKIGVDLFVLIMGYFLIDSNFKIKKVFQLETQILTYSIGISIVFVLLKYVNISMSAVIKTIFPVITNSYWFVTSYIIIYMIFPIINKIIKSLNKRSNVKILITLIILLFFLPTFFNLKVGVSNIGTFLTMYYMGAMIKIYSSKYNIGKMGYRLLLGNLTFSIIGFASLNLAGILFNIEQFLNKSTHFFDDNSVFMLGIAVGLFLIFLNKKEFSNKYINFIASLSFGVYLIHDNFLMRPILWNNIFHVHTLLKLNPVVFVLAAFLITFVIYVVCSLIDMVRLLFISKIFNGSILNKLFNEIWNLIYPIIVKILKFFRLVNDK
ncbi:acyltransferase family protein [Companilactobacillus farciminis]|uniref:acyltransferase family protein n=1 Tax=Companilactobacillus farciminis TaxID=1612 RepID=UPI00232D569E|nr:acyltransferase family protein [Companilactobacillus farciminis]WCG36005.1 acyltransferase family protein [Companilactobacillus farciminis]